MNISVEDLLKLDSPNIIDIRSIQSFNNNHIPGAINIPSDELKRNYNKYLNKNEVYYLYCTRGMTSHNVCMILQRYGYKVYNIIGGYEAWLLAK